MQIRWKEETFLPIIKGANPFAAIRAALEAVEDRPMATPAELSVRREQLRRNLHRVSSELARCRTR